MCVWEIDSYSKYNCCPMETQETDIANALIGYE